MVMRALHTVGLNTLQWMDLTLDKQSPGHQPLGQSMAATFVNKSLGGGYLYTLRRETKQWQDGELYWHWEISCADHINNGPEKILVRGTEMHCRMKIAEELATRNRSTHAPPKPITQQPANYGDW